VVYYGQNQLTAPPGFVLDPNTQGYVAKSPLQEAQSLSLNAPLDTTLQPLPLPGQIDTSGQVDPTAPNAQVLTSASPLYGIRQWTTPQTGPQQANPLQTPAGPQPSTGVSGPLSQEQIIQMRQQLYRTVVPPTTPTGNEMTLPPVNPGGNGGLAPLAPSQPWHAIADATEHTRPAAVDALAAWRDGGHAAARAQPAEQAICANAKPLAAV